MFDAWGLLFWSDLNRGWARINADAFGVASVVESLGFVLGGRDADIYI